MMKASRATVRGRRGRSLWSLDSAGRALGMDRETLFEWLYRERYAYRRTGIGTGTKLAYMHWVRAGLFENRSEVMITAAGIRMLAREMKHAATAEGRSP